MVWARTEFRNLNSGDKRLKNRSVKLIENLAMSPKSSMPETCQGWAVFLTTDTALSENGILGLYSMRWAIEVYFHEAKQLLVLLK